MGADALAQRIGQPPIRARELLRLHRETYRVFWRWSDAAVDYAMLNGSLHTVFGWRVQVPPISNPRSLATSPCKQMVPRCSGWPAAWPPKQVLKSAHLS